MPIEITVAPPGLTISQGRTFMVTDQRGEINPSRDEGVYAIDTRFIDAYRLFLNREPWELVTASQLSFYAARVHLTNPRIRTEDGDLDAHTLGLTINRTVGEGIHEDFDLMNYTTNKIRCVLELDESQLNSALPHVKSAFATASNSTHCKGVWVCSASPQQPLLPLLKMQKAVDVIKREADFR